MNYSASKQATSLFRIIMLNKSMSWLSNHDLSAMLTGLTNLRRQQQSLLTKDGRKSLCQSRCCLQCLLSRTMNWSVVFAADRLSQPKSNETVPYIVNSAKEGEEGQHWLVVRVMPY